ncbi:DNA repair exonuclease [uncultured Algimonas sp.]|uniref:metallophosphoesterase family protein n=1 Tax=uncultured Algimonas sp. TaxID=1547920 RepID=UPI0026066239|nr:DNA repair exonuclease [uncultured Algimonas sp.]
MAIRFIHTADWQLGKRFGRFEDRLSGRLTAERQEAVARIAHAARSHGAAHVIVAGDAWDNANPNDSVLRQPLEIMGESADVTWWLLPGNHDPDGAEGLWDRISDAAPDNVQLLRTAEPVEMTENAWLLPAPWQRLHHGRDLTAWMDTAPTPEGDIRIGVAHGSIRTFGTKLDGRDDGDSDAVIPPDRAARARLDYLALGDWHARTAVNARTHYPGTPEPDRFKPGRRGQVLLVEIEAAGAEPVITDLPTAAYDWPVIEAALRVDGLDEAVQRIGHIVGEGRAARHTLAEIRVSGETTLQEWSEFEWFIDTLTDRCAHIDLRGGSSVALKVVAEDMDALDAQGSVRRAAETLKARREDGALSQADRETASEALRLLFSFAAIDEASS